ncbi:MAG TPA: acyclic terpene utilization AtuA family protein, partial [Mycobacterium sp.]|nr:acyclic terpene utilization AtuA family protein [Mycobacterium sp.]
TGRVTDASVVVGSAAAHFGWARTDYDALAGAVAAGHVIECGAQATGGNYAFFGEIADLTHPGFPLAEVHADGSSVITKHPGTGGAVSVGTVTAQLLYEITGARYANPDVTLRVDTIELSDDGPDRVRISGVKGEPPPPTLKVSLNSIGGFRNEMTLVLTGLDIEAKAALVRRQLETSLTVKPAEMQWTLARTDHADADTEEAASALLRCVVRDPAPANVGRQFSSAAVELALASYPGFTSTTPPGDGQVYGVFTPGFVPAAEVPHVAVHADGTRVDITPATQTLGLAPVPPFALPEPLPFGETRCVPLGMIAGARSGDKGGSANVGVWVRTDEQWRWLAHTLTVEKLRELLPETADLTVTRHVLPNLRAVNFVIDGILGQGVAYQARFDPQAKGLGEWLRSRHVDIPESIL